jgi:hypothetical protein
MTVTGVPRGKLSLPRLHQLRASERVMARVRPAKHSGAGTPRLPFRYCFVKSVERRIACFSADIVRACENSQGRQCYFGKLLAACKDRLRRCRQTARLTPFRLGQCKWRPSNSRWVNGWRRQIRKLFLEFTWYIIGVSICSLQIYECFDSVSVPDGQITHFLSRERVTDKHRLLDAKRIEDRQNVFAETRDVISGLGSGRSPIPTTRYSVNVPKVSQFRRKVVVDVSSIAKSSE